MTQEQEAKKYAEWAHFNGGIVTFDSGDYVEGELEQLIFDLREWMAEKGYRVALAIKAGDKGTDQETRIIALEDALAAAEARLRVAEEKAALVDALRYGLDGANSVFDLTDAFRADYDALTSDTER